MLVLGVEADAAEAARLQATAPPNRRYYAAALGARRERRALYITALPAASGFHRSEELFSRFTNADAAVVVDHAEVDVVDLDTLSREQQLPPIDFLKIDVQGAELDVLAGADTILRRPDMLGVELEVWFDQRPKEISVFAETDAFLRERGFHLFDLDTYRYARKTHAASQLYDLRDDSGRRFGGPAERGQILTGDALYLRDPIADGAALAETATLKLACLYELYGLADCAAELLIAAGRVELADLLGA